MIRKLQWKFILLSMSAFALILVVIISAINIVNYSAIVAEADTLVDILSENKGHFPKGPGDMPEAHHFPQMFPEMSPETPYETRYFSVTVTSDTLELVQAETSRIVSVNAQQAEAYAREVIRGEKTRGFADNYRYRVRTDGMLTQITFLDCGRKLDAFAAFLGASIGISLLGYAIVFLCICFFSQRIIRPISESYEKQTRFITDAGHEIKTPLTIIRADADVLEMEIGDNEWLTDIRRQTEQLTDLTNDLVFLSRMEEAGNAVPMIEFPFSDVVLETAQSFQALARDKVLCLQVQELLTLRGNDRQIRQLVSILMDNALKYSPEDGVISLTAEETLKGIRLTVFNTTAHSVDPKTLPLLFDRFYRADPSRNSKTGGHGIGLSVAKAIVAAHGGRISASTQDGQSLTVTVVFPA